MRRTTRCTLLLAVALVAGACAPPRWQGELWLWSSANLADSASAARVAALWRRAARAGYVTVVLSDLRFSRLATQDSAYFGRLRMLQSLADSMHMELVPAVLPLGRGQGAMLEVDPDLAEALPVREALFEVQGGVAHLVPDPPVSLAAIPDRRGRSVRLADGVLSVRNPWLGARAAWTVRVAPWRCYHLAAEARTEAFTAEPSIKVRAAGREIAFARLPIASTQPWTRCDVVFNSLADSLVTIHIGAKAPARGELAWRNWRLEECGPVNLVRRASTPFVAEGLREGVDLEPVRDSLLGNSPWRGQFTAWHAPPRLRVHRPDGTRFRASWWQAPVIERGQVAVCLTDSRASAQIADEAARVRTRLHPRSVLLQHDEIRTLGWDPTCLAHGRTPGQILADNLRFCRMQFAGTRICVWNDMFDPYHNATARGWLVNGDLAGSWEGLDSNVVVLNWNPSRLRESLAFFAARHHRQVYAGYYDNGLADFEHDLPLLARTPGVFAVMYTTWRNRYDDLEGFARLARAGR